MQNQEIREVTVGRSPNSDIPCGAQCVTVSSHHALIYMDGDTLMYRDTSTNGTLINNMRVLKRAVPIHEGDSILLAGQYPLSWSQIRAFFPRPAYREPVSYREPTRIQQAPVATPVEDVSKWSWGAFGLYQFWGLFNGMWWTLLIGMFLGWLFPIPNILFGIMGRRWSWQNKHWDSYLQFESSQKPWDVVGIIVFVLGIIGYIFIFASMM